MSDSTPTARDPAPLLLLAAIVDDPAVAGWRAHALGVSGDVLLLDAAADWRAEMIALRSQYPGRALIRVRSAEIELAYDALARLLKAARATATSVLPLSNSAPELTPAAPDSEIDAADAATIDAAIFALSARELAPIATNDPPLWLLGESADATLAPALVDHVYAHLPGIAIIGLPTPADRRERAPAHPLASLRSALLATGVRTASAWTTAARDDKPVVLHILHGWGGGAERYVGDLGRADAERHHLVLRAHGNPTRRRHGERMELSAAAGGPVLRRALMSPAIASLADQHSGYAQALSELIADFAVEQIIVSSLIGHSLDALRTGLPTVWVAHDYFPFWPVLHRDFGAAQARFDHAQLEHDLASQRFSPFAEEGADFWHATRAATLAALAATNVPFVAPSRSVLVNLARIVPALAERPQRVIPHGIANWPTPVSQLPAPDCSTGRLRLVVIGRINGGKGLDLLRELAPRLGAFAELFLVGCGKAAEALFGIGGVHVMLDYAHAELPAILARLRPHAALLPVTVAETFSYTLSELWSLSVPPIAARLGALAERIVDGENGILIEGDAQAWLARLLGVDQDRSELESIRAHLTTQPVRSMEAALADYAALLPNGKRAALRYPVRHNDPKSLALAVESDARTDAQLRLTDAERRLTEQHAELERRAHWGFDLAAQVDERTAWARDLEAELKRVRAWLGEREGVFQHALSDAHTRGQATEARLIEVQWELKQHMEEAKAIQAALDERVEQLSRALSDRMRELNTLSDENQQLLSARHDLTQQREQLEASRAALFAEHQALHQASQYQQRLNEHLRYERDAVVAHREQILSSTSWRLTTPLRAGGLLAKRIRASLKFRLQRLVSLIGRVRGSLARRGLAGTLARARQELRDSRAHLPAAISVSTPEPASEYLPFTMPVSSSPLVSIVIPVYNQLHHTWNCLSALAETAGTTPFEVIVVDDGSSDATAREIPRIAGVRFHKNPENLGFIGACNAGAALAQGRFVFFLNNDTAVQPGWLEPLVRTFDEYERVGLVGSKLVYPDGRLQEAGGVVFNDGSGWNYGRFEHPDDPRYDFPREVDYCSGAAILIERALFERFGGFDSLYKPAYYEDTDLGFKVREAGLRVIYQPASRVVHFEGITGGTDTSTGIKRYQVINQVKFRERWADALLRQPAPTDHAGIGLAATHRAKGRILMIDATTATPDQDSGSVRYVNLLRVLHTMGWQATFFADNRAYIPRYTEELRALGVEVQFHPWLADPVAFFRARGREFDAVMLSRHYVARHYVDLVREYAPQARLLFDTVDLHYLREQRAAAVDGSDALARQAEATRDAELDLVRRCDATIVVSPVEQELLGREARGHRVEVLSNIHKLVGCRANYGARKDIWFVGGFQHQPNVDAMQWFVADIWPRVRPSLPEVVFHIVGSKLPPEIAALAGNGVEVHGFVSDLDGFLDGCRLAVAPLRYGAGVKGKVNQSMAHGQPVVATPIAVEGMAIESGVEALVADSAEHFAEAIVQLYRDGELWQRLSDAGLENTRRHFSFEAARVGLERILRG
jgi:GT2 family glycosyltransferase/glycosyltransferase involved in cell wall biosynthesis